MYENDIDSLIGEELPPVSGPSLGRSDSQAWLQYMIEYTAPDLDPKTKEEIIRMLKPLMDSAAKSSLRRREVPMHLLQYDIIWDDYYTYKKRGRYDPTLVVLKDVLREAFTLQLNKSITDDGTDKGNLLTLLLTNKHDVRTRNESPRKRRFSFFKNQDDYDMEMR